MEPKLQLALTNCVQSCEQEAGDLGAERKRQPAQPTGWTRASRAWEEQWRKGPRAAQRQQVALGTGDLPNWHDLIEESRGGTATSDLLRCATQNFQRDARVEPLEDRRLRGHVTPARIGFAESVKDGQRVWIRLPWALHAMGVQLMCRRCEVARWRPTVGK